MSTEKSKLVVVHKRNVDSIIDVIAATAPEQYQKAMNYQPKLDVAWRKDKFIDNQSGVVANDSPSRSMEVAHNGFAETANVTTANDSGVDMKIMDVIRLEAATNKHDVVALVAVSDDKVAKLNTGFTENMSPIIGRIDNILEVDFTSPRKPAGFDIAS